MTNLDYNEMVLMLQRENAFLIEATVELVKTLQFIADYTEDAKMSLYAQQAINDYGGKVK